MSTRRGRWIAIMLALLALGALLIWRGTPGPTPEPPKSVEAPANQHITAEAASPRSRPERVREPVDTYADSIDDDPADDPSHAGPAPVVRLRWLRVSKPGDVVRIAGTDVELEVENLADHEIEVDLDLAADGGTAEVELRRLPLVTLHPHGVSQVPIDLAGLGWNLDAMPFSGRAIVRARASAHPGADTSSPPLYFHADPSRDRGVLVYDQHALDHQFSSGDFRGSARMAAEPGTTTERIVAAVVTVADADPYPPPVDQ